MGHEVGRGTIAAPVTLAFTACREDSRIFGHSGSAAKKLQFGWKVANDGYTYKSIS